MKKNLCISLLCITLWILISVHHQSFSFGEPIIIDHTCTDISKIPDEWIDAAQSNVKIYYGHTSHGAQLTVGLERIESSNSKFDVDIIGIQSPSQLDALCICNSDGVEPGSYYETEAGRQLTQNILNQYPAINVSIFGWCGQLNYYTEEQVQTYLNVMAAFEEANPDVVFVYMTGNAQADPYSRYLRNEQIRRWVKDHPEKNRVLYDFADLDSWWYNPQTHEWEQRTLSYNNGSEIIYYPFQHKQFEAYEGDPDYACHTNFESCEQKGKAVWWMVARLAGWSGTPSLITLDTFQAFSQENQILITWITDLELDTEGFNLNRSESRDDKYIRINPTLISAKGGDTWGADYSYIDNTVEPGVTYYYKLEEIENDGTSTYYGPVSATVSAHSGVSRTYEIPYIEGFMYPKPLWPPFYTIPYFADVYSSSLLWRPPVSGTSDQKNYSWYIWSRPLESATIWYPFDFFNNENFFAWYWLR